MGKRRFFVSCLVLGLVPRLFPSHSVSALTYQSRIGVNFALDSSLSLTVSGDLLIDNLVPGNFSDSNTIQVTVNTNNAYGYKLTATVGNTNNSSSELRHSTYSTSGDPVFSSIALNASLARSSFSSGTTYDDKWGYSTNGTSYNGLPVEGSSDDPVTILSSDYMPTNGTASSNFLIGAKASSNKASGDYTNVINFYVVANTAPVFLYDKVAEMSKGKFTEAKLREAIETPTTNSWATDTSNSGVYEYNAGVFGPSSDISASNKIYIYRGILENNPGTYGSAGSAVTYPNYVKLANDTCWRIVRTTGSGGVKMIYNGVFGTTASGSCANDQVRTSVGRQTYATQGSSQYSGSDCSRNIHYVGYTYNDDVTDATDTRFTDEVFGGDTDPTLNNSRSNIKQYLEDTWYANNMTYYTNMLEASAGYCNDRSLYFSAQLSPTLLSMIIPYKTQIAEAFFGSGERLTVVGAVPTLGCPRSVVDLYRYVENSSGLGNELKYPVALLTADEAALAGSGYSDTTTPYSRLSYLFALDSFWLLSPYRRTSNGYAIEFYITSTAKLNNDQLMTNNANIRPVVSLKSGTIITGGSGIASDPWTIE